MRNLKCFEEFELEEDRYEIIKNRISDMLENEHTIQEIKDFYEYFSNEVKLLPEEQKRELIDFYMKNHKNVKIKKFPVRRSSGGDDVICPTWSA